MEIIDDMELFETGRNIEKSKTDLEKEKRIIENQKRCLELLTEVCELDKAAILTW